MQQSYTKNELNYVGNNLLYKLIQPIQAITADQAVPKWGVKWRQSSEAAHPTNYFIISHNLSMTANSVSD